MSRVQERIVELLRVEFNFNDVHSTTSFVRDLGMDSVKLLSFLMLLENESKVDIFGLGLDLTNTHTVEALAKFIEENSR
jgi:acyl carrier protein